MTMSVPTFEPTLEPTAEPTAEPTLEPTFQPSIIIASSTKQTLTERLTAPRVLASFVAAGTFLALVIVLGCHKCCVRKFRNKVVDQDDAAAQVNITPTKDNDGDAEKDEESPDDFVTNPPKPTSASDTKEGTVDLSTPTSLFSRSIKTSSPTVVDNDEDVKDVESPDTFEDDGVVTTSPDQNQGKIDLSLPTGIFSKKHVTKYDDDDEEEATPSIQPSLKDDQISYADEADVKEEEDSLISEDDESYVGVQHSIRNLFTAVSRGIATTNPSSDDDTGIDAVNDTIIRNNRLWTCKSVADGEKVNVTEDNPPVYASLGGHITKFDHDEYYYWVGTDPREVDSSNRIYRSRTMGSETWELFKTIQKRTPDHPNEDKENRKEKINEGLLIKPENENTLSGKVQGRRNCTLLYCAEEGYYIVYCKGVGIYKATTIDGEWNYEKTLKETDLLANLITHTRGGCTPYANLDPNHFHAGGMSAYSENGKAFLIISMREEERSASLKDIHLNDNYDEIDDDGKEKQVDRRFVLIVQMTPNFLDVDKVVLWKQIPPQREAFWLFRRKPDEKEDIWVHYMTYDGPGGWEGSDSFYRTSKKNDPLGEQWIEGYPLNNNPFPPSDDPWSDEGDILFHPNFREIDNERLKYRKDLRSFASQQRYIMQVGDQWIYGGDRYPEQEPESHNLSHGYHIMCPIKWGTEEDPLQPTVVIQRRWDIANYKSDRKPWGGFKDFRYDESVRAEEIKNARKESEEAAVREGRTSIGIRTSRRVFLITNKRSNQDDYIHEIPFAGMVYSGVRNHFLNLVLKVTTSPNYNSLSEAIGGIEPLVRDNTDSHHINLLVGGVDPDNTPHMYCIDPAGNSSDWNIAVTGEFSKKVTEELKKLYKNVLFDDNNLPDQNIVHALEALSAALATENREDEMTPENIEIGVLNVNTESDNAEVKTRNLNLGGTASNEQFQLLPRSDVQRYLDDSL